MALLRIKMMNYENLKCEIKNDYFHVCILNFIRLCHSLTTFIPSI